MEGWVPRRVTEREPARAIRDAEARLRVEIDFGVGDVMVPGSRMIEYQFFLGGDTMQLFAYPVESAIAEKLQAMVALGGANSRMKDFYDVRICARHLDFDAATLLEAIEATFKSRGAPVPAEKPEALTLSFVEQHRIGTSITAELPQLPV